ncbi:acyltransferase [Vibrio sp. 03-59-1]|uniref:acyltransferase n=1 Tax=Vibrio sp. 03-59-1 TaxID=2607607 RepID=UPI001493CA96|nr:acyltransferase [Vibrio sp. 03-59-1]NOH84367.1 acyltransferase [Vibrio sp. 03-59-1]
MLATKTNEFKSWLKDHPNPKFRNLFLFLKQARMAELPTPHIMNKIFYGVYTFARNSINEILRILFHTPTFKGRLSRYGKRLYLYGGIPYISGPLTINIGSDCRISGQTTFSGRSSSQSPTLTLGHNIGIGWQTTIAVGQQVVLGDNVRLAGGVFLCGYSGHPLDPVRRAKGEADDETQVGNIILEKDVWLGSNVTVMSHVTIGQGTVVATGSVVTKDLPPFVIAAGNPAKVIRSIPDSQTHQTEGERYA